MKIIRDQEKITFKDVVSLDQIDTDVSVKLEINYDKGGFKVKPVLHSKHGYSEEFKDVLDSLIETAFETGETKMAAFCQENGIGTQGDLFGAPASAEN